MFTRVDAMSMRLRKGTVTNDFNRDITNMFRDIRNGLTGTGTGTSTSTGTVR